MKEILLKFLETQNLSTIITELVVLFTAWQTWRKYKDSNKTKFKQTFLKSLGGTNKINELLVDLQNSFEGKNIIPAVAEITNGGGVPKADRPLYIRAVNSPNSEVLQLWGNKSLVVAPLTKTIITLINNGFSYLDIDKFELKKIDFWAGAKQIERVHYFIIGYRSKALTILAINTETKEDLTDQELLIAHTYASKIKEEYNSSVRFWESKMT